MTSALGLEAHLAGEGERRTEIPAKLTCRRLEREYAGAGPRLAAWWTDSRGGYALSLAVLA